MFTWKITKNFLQFQSKRLLKSAQAKLLLMVQKSCSKYPDIYRVEYIPGTSPDFWIINGITSQPILPGGQNPDFEPSLRRPLNWAFVCPSVLNKGEMGPLIGMVL